jgi:hypothetical protein
VSFREVLIITALWAGLFLAYRAGRFVGALEYEAHHRCAEGDKK